MTTHEIDTDRPVLFKGHGYTLRALGDKHKDDYSLRHGGLYVEFSSVKWSDMVWLLYSRDSGTYMSLRHDTENGGDIPNPLYHLLESIRHGTISMSDEPVAFGEYEVDGVGSPAQQAGYDGMYDENPWYERLEDQYDTYARMLLWESRGNDYDEVPDNPDHWLSENTDLDEGTIPAWLARTAWFKAWDAQDADEEAKDVAEVLGWL